MYKAISKNTQEEIKGQTQDEVIRNILFFIMSNPCTYGWKIMKNDKTVMFLDNNGNKLKKK